MRGRKLDNFEQAQLGVHIHDRSVGGESELHVGVRLPGLWIEAMRAPWSKLARLLDDGVAEEGRQGDDLLAVRSDHRVVLDAQLARRVQLRLGKLERSLADGLRRGLHGAAGDIGLTRGGRGAGGADPGVRVQDDDVADAQLRTRDLSLHRDDALAHLCGG